MENGDPWTVPAGSVFLFGVSKVSHFHRNTLVEISRMPRVDMHVFLTNPCAEFWEDVNTWRSRRYPRKWRHDSPPEKTGVPPRNPADYNKSELEDFAHLPHDPPLLELWGRAGKENIYLWCPQAEWNFEYYCPPDAEEETPPATLLGALQKALLRRERDLPGAGGGRKWESDGTLEIIACPDPAREIEELRERILDLVLEDKEKKGSPPLRLSDIAVYLPDPGACLAQIHRVFGAYRHDDPAFIPYAVLGAPGSDSVFAQGMRVLLEIIEGHFDRARVFSLLRNPIVAATRDISDGDVTVWEEWAGELGMYRGFNKEHRGTMGDKGQMLTDVHTFGLGIARLLLGNLSAGPVNLRFRLDADDGNGPFSPIPPYRDFSTSDADSVERFCGLCEDLHTGADTLTGMIAGGTLAGAVDAMTSFVRDWFGTVPEDKTGNMAAEARVRNEFMDALQSIKLQVVPGSRGRRAEPDEFIALVNNCLPGELPASSKAWTGGITFAPLRPAMVVPHRVIFAQGLGATAFPGTSETPAWDLLARKRIVGDSDRVRDNRFAFLELLHAARERLILSFRARNMQKEEELQPSSVVLELESYLKAQGIMVAGTDGREERCGVRREIPWIVHESLDGISRSGRRRHGSWDPSEIRLARLDGIPEKKDRYDRPPETRGKKEVPTTGPLRTDLYGLRKYFANPLEYHLSKTLGIELDEQPGTMGATDEPLQSGSLEMAGLHKTIWSGLLEKVFPGNKTDACTDAAALNVFAGALAEKAHREYRILAGSPEAQFSAMEGHRLAAFARECVPETLALLDSFGDHRLLRNADLSLGRRGVPGDLEIDLGEGVSCAVSCRHALALVPRNGGGTAAIIVVKKEGEAKDNPDLWLSGVLQRLADERSGDGQEIALLQLNRGDEKKKKTGCSRAAMKKACDSRGNLEEWFAGFIREMLVGRCSDHLPFAVVQDLASIDDSGSLNLSRLSKDTIEEALEREFSPYRCYLEAFALVDARIPVTSDEDLQKRARNRFAPMLEGWVHG
jgi:exodeoxyribonuclease V gamma subunit